MVWFQKKRMAFVGSLLLPLLSSVAVVAQNDTVISLECQGSSCDECLANGCGWFPFGNESKCVKSCTIIADAACYSAEFSPNATGAEICAAVNQDQVDGQICASANATKDCDSCTSTLQSDGTTTCQWFASTSSCGPAGTCNFLGCGNDTCAAANSTFQQTDCKSATTCGECVVDLDDCAWAAGMCMGNCSEIADAKCYSTELFPGTSRSEICDVASQDAEIESLCVAPTTCSACIDTEKPDGSGTCEWYETGNRCGSGGCDINGECGVSRCNTDPPCSNATSCGECLGIDCAWTSAECLESCDIIADVPCYNTDTFSNSSDAEICDIATLVQADIDLCVAQTSCENCTLAVLSDGSSTCQWFAPWMENDGNCCGGGAACDLPGVGTSTCNATTKVCGSATTCGACVETGCAWAVGTCLESCSDIADAPCYSSEFFANKTSAEICEKEKIATADEAICRNQTNCKTCTSTKKTGGFQGCQWYRAEGSDTEYCGTGACDSNAVCGTRTCIEATCDIHTSCGDCLNGGCAWSAGSCLEICNVFVDASCVSAKQFANKSIEEVCKIEKIITDDEALCSNKTSCRTCTSTAKSGGTGNCKWYEYTNGTSASCGTGGCDHDFVCGSSECSKVTGEVSKLQSSAMRQTTWPLLLVLGFALLGVALFG